MIPPAIRRALLTRNGRVPDARCGACGFRMFGQSSRCPECGRPFDPANPLSLRQPERTDWCDWAMTAIVLVFGLVIVAGMLVRAGWI